MVRISDDLLKLAKKQAVDEGRSLTSLIEEGLMLVLSETRPSRSKRFHLPVSKATGGTLPGVDLNRSSVLEEVMNSS